MLNHLQPFLPADIIAKLAQHARPVLSLKLTHAADDLPLTASRVGGFGYWPESEPYPENDNGQPLSLLAQLNLGELPPHPDLPRQGILAFYINPFHWNYGMDEESGYRAVYFADTNTPSLSREKQRELFPDDAFLEAEHYELSEEVDQMLSEWMARGDDEMSEDDDDIFAQFATVVLEGEEDDEDADDAADVAAIFARYLDESDEFVEAENDGELAHLWAEERARLIADPPQDKAEMLMILTATGAISAHLLRQSKVNPVAQSLVREWYGFDGEFESVAPAWYHPVAGEYAVQATLGTHYPFAEHDEFTAIFGQSFYDWVRDLALDEAVKREFVELALQNESHLMGYPYFTQDDPREGNGDVLLFQLDSQEVDGEYGSVMWGESGVGRFFIAREDLAARRFDKAWLNWDCY